MINTKDGEVQIKIRCSRCNSTQNFLRIKTMERVCRWCGNIEAIKIKEETKHDKKKTA